MIKKQVLKSDKILIVKAIEFQMFHIKNIIRQKMIETR